MAEGLWWKQEANVTGCLALVNTTKQAIAANVDIADNTGAALRQQTVTVSPARDQAARTERTECGKRLERRNSGHLHW